MKQTWSFPLYEEAAAPLGGWEAVAGHLKTLGLDGLEGIWAGTDIPPAAKPLVTGYHLTFHPDWLDLYLGNRQELIRKFGSMERAAAFYGFSDGDGLLAQYRQDLQRALELGAEYVVFHVSDVSLEEGYTYRWLHSDEAVIDASAESINELLQGVPGNFLFLMENQWWPGLTFTDPKKTERLRSRVADSRAGFLLDTGHLMNTCTALRTQEAGAAYIRQMVQAHGSLAGEIHGIHLHYSLSGAYVQANTGVLPPLPEDYTAQFGVSYGHILQIDQHLPWTDPAICAVLEEIDPAYLTHELSGDRLAAAAIQAQTLRNGWK